MLNQRCFLSRFVRDRNGISTLTEMRREPVWHLGLVLKCASCLLIVAGIALIGATADLSSPTTSGNMTAGGSAQDREREFSPISLQAAESHPERAALSAEHHRKAVFDERRRAWEQRRYSGDKRIAVSKDEP